MITVERLKTLGCMKQGCEHKHHPVALICKKCFDQLGYGPPVKAVGIQKEGVVEITCNKCDRHICDLKLAESE